MNVFVSLNFNEDGSGEFVSEFALAVGPQVCVAFFDIFSSNSCFFFAAYLFIHLLEYFRFLDFLE